MDRDPEYHFECNEEIDELAAQVRARDEIIGRAQESEQDLRAQVATLTAERDAARNWLANYGAHLSGCAWRCQACLDVPGKDGRGRTCKVCNGFGYMNGRCSCGLRAIVDGTARAALAGKE